MSNEELLTMADKRSFFLMLSPSEGQELAQIAGFSPPSKDVSDVEFVDTLAKWTVMALSGSLEIALEASKWMAAFLGTRNSLSSEEVKRYEIIFYGFGAALVSLLMDQEIIDLKVESDDEDTPIEQLSSMLAILFPPDEDDDDDEDDE